MIDMFVVYVEDLQTRAPSPPPTHTHTPRAGAPAPPARQRRSNPHGVPSLAFAL